jgi:uncharacterized protein
LDISGSTTRRYRRVVTERFEWDEAKARTNAQRHSVSFAEAVTVFDDPLAALFDDPNHSQREERRLLIGNSARHRLLVVTYTERGGAIRVIGARRATRRERRAYEDAQE